MTKLGVNYWPGYAGPRMWRDFRPDEIKLDLEALRGVGIEYLRAFTFWPDFMPTPTRVEPVMLERLREFLDLCHEVGLGVHLSLIVGHMSGENWSPVWLEDQLHRDPTALYRDPLLLERQEFFARTVVAAVAGHPAVAAYVLSNEIPIYGGSSDKASVGGWVKRLYAAVKSLEPNIPISVGDGAWYCMGEDNGFSHEHDQDILGPHLYLPERTPETQLAAYGLSIGTARALAGGREVWLEEYGASQNTFGEEEIAKFAADVALEARMHGATHVCWWCGLDFELIHDLPYEHHAFELVFGLLNADRTPKAVAHALRRAVSQPLPNLPEVGLLVPSYLHERYPFSWEDREIVKRALLNSYATLRRLGYAVRIVLERQFLEKGVAPKLLFVPSTQKLLAPTWRALERYSSLERHSSLEQHGSLGQGHVVYSYFHGSSTVHQGAWIDRPRSFFGGKPRNRYGLPEQPPSRLRSSHGDFALPSSENIFARTPLLLEPEGATVIGRDEFERPMWLRLENRDLILYPLEALASGPDEIEAIYRAVLESIQQPAPESPALVEAVAADD